MLLRLITVTEWKMEWLTAEKQEKPTIFVTWCSDKVDVKAKYPCQI